jgi:hypothetical protein
MQPREHSSKYNKTLGIAPVGLDLYLADFVLETIDSTVVKDKAELGRLNTLMV